MLREKETGGKEGEVEMEQARDKEILRVTQEEREGEGERECKTEMERAIYWQRELQLENFFVSISFYLSYVNLCG